MATSPIGASTGLPGPGLGVTNQPLTTDNPHAARSAQDVHSIVTETLARFTAAGAVTGGGPSAQKGAELTGCPAPTGPPPTKYKNTAPTGNKQQPTQDAQQVGTKQASSPTTYTVRRGDYLIKIAARYGVTWQDIYRANRNKISNPNLIYPGQVLTIPGAKRTPSRAPETNPRPPRGSSGPPNTGPRSPVDRRPPGAQPGPDATNPAMPPVPDTSGLPPSTIGPLG